MRGAGGGQKPWDALGGRARGGGLCMTGASAEGFIGCLLCVWLVESTDLAPCGIGRKSEALSKNCVLYHGRICDTQKLSETVVLIEEAN